MHANKSRVLILALTLIAAIVPMAAQQKTAHLPTPSEFLGFEVGADRKLADYHQIASYFKALSAASDRVQVEVLGKTTLGRRDVHGRDLHSGKPAQQS